MAEYEDVKDFAGKLTELALKQGILVGMGTVVLVDRDTRVPLPWVLSWDDGQYRLTRQHIE